MHWNDMCDIARVHFVRILSPQNQSNEVRVLSVSRQFATTTAKRLATTKSQIATGVDYFI